MIEVGKELELEYLRSDDGILRIPGSTPTMRVQRVHDAEVTFNVESDDDPKIDEVDEWRVNSDLQDTTLIKGGRQRPYVQYDSRIEVVERSGEGE